MSTRLTAFREELLPAALFADRAFAACSALESGAEVFLRTGDAKNLLEEVLPLAVFAKFFDAIERRVRCRYLGGSGDEADAELVLSGRTVELGFYPSRILVEVTCAEDSKKAYLRREALAVQGGVFLGTDIARSAPRHHPDSRIISRAVAQDPDHYPSELADLVSAAIAKKAGKHYDPPRVLVVRYDPDGFLDPAMLRSMLAAVIVPEGASGISAVFLTDCSSGNVSHVW